MMDLDIAREFLKGSELALDNELCRPAVANAYYAMFWAARAALRHVGIVRGEWSHGGLQQSFGLELIKKRGLIASGFGDWFSRAYQLRRVAHYTEAGVGVKESRRLVQHTQEFVTSIEEVVGE